jgi:hypothetical protein
MSVRHEPARSAGARLGRWAAARPDGTLLLWLFRAMVAATVVVLALDLAELRSQGAAYREPPVGPWGEPRMRDVLPSVRTSVPAHPGRAAPARELDFSSPASFELVGDGRMLLTGAIDPGAADRFAEEIEKRGDYIRTVVLASPGGSVNDALRIGRLIRENGFATEVEAGSYCASSCPLIFAGGEERIAGEGAAIGVHQVFTVSDAAMSGNQGMHSAQRTSAECQRYLMDMGIDLRVWLHAMETPADELFYFTADELTEFGLATRIDGDGA